MCISKHLSVMDQTPGKPQLRLSTTNLPSAESAGNCKHYPPRLIPFLHFPEHLYPNAELPKGTGGYFPRVVDADRFVEEKKRGVRFDLSDLQVPDMIVTVLYKHNESVLKAFLNPDYDNIAYYQQYDARRLAFFIMKQGSRVRESCIYHADWTRNGF